MFEDDAIKEGTEALVLGPAYFDARKVAERCIGQFESEHFKPLVDKLVDEFREKAWESVQNGLLMDVEMNLQSEMWRMVDASVQALLGGHRWALQKYALGERYDCDEIRAVVAKHVPAELQDKRIADLEHEIGKLKSELDWARRH